MKKIGLLVTVILLLTLSGAVCQTVEPKTIVQTETVTAEPTSTSATTTSGDTSYFDANAKVMLFYSEYCSWCIKQKEVLASLAGEGYKVKPMDVGSNQNLWKEYNISGTPTFIGPDGQKLVGFQDKTKLKEFLDKYK